MAAYVVRRFTELVTFVLILIIRIIGKKTIFFNEKLREEKKKMCRGKLNE